MDSFTQKIKALIDGGSMAGMSGDVFKSLLIRHIQTHSAEIPYLEEEISDLFLNLTDMLVTGAFNRIPHDAFKAYVVLAIYGADSESGDAMRNQLHALTGIQDHPSLQKALEDLKVRGYLESVEEPVLNRLRPHARNKDHEMEMVG